MNEMHEANRKYWDAAAPDWKKLDENDWRKCKEQPSVAFRGGTALSMINEFVGELHGKRVCIIGSGDNYAAFALAGLGAVVTSTDISQPRLDIAAQRAHILGLNIDFVRCDAAHLTSVSSAGFDLVCSTNGFFVWLADLAGVFAEVNRVLKPGGYYIFYDIHPFQRPWKEQTAIEVEKPYFQTGPFASEESGTTAYNFHWMLSDIINNISKSGLNVCRISETPAIYSSSWQGPSYGHGTDDSLLDWHYNSRAALPFWLTLAARKPPV
jgi:SAM-dependent methyltransferase